MPFSVAMTFSSFSPFRTSRTRSDLNLALKFLLVRGMFFESSMLVVLCISDSLKTVCKNVCFYGSIILRKDNAMSLKKAKNLCRKSHFVSLV